MGSIRISASSMWASKNGVLRLVYVGQKSCTEEARWEAMKGRDVKFYSLGGDGQLIEHWAAAMDFLKRYVEIPFEHAVALMEKCEALPLLPPHALEKPEPDEALHDYYLATDRGTRARTAPVSGQYSVRLARPPRHYNEGHEIHASIVQGCNKSQAIAAAMHQLISNEATRNNLRVDDNFYVVSADKIEEPHD